MPNYSGVWNLVSQYQAKAQDLWPRVTGWIATLGGTGYDYGQGIALDSSGNVYVGGTSTGLGNDDFLITKYNNLGVIQWQRILRDTSGSDNGRAIAVDSSGNSYITGVTQVGGTNDVMLFKYDTNGTLQWQNRLGKSSGGGGFAGDFGQGIAVDSSANVYVAGYTDSQGAGGNDALIVKYNSSGAVQWQRSLGGTGNTDQAYAIALDSSANVYIAGNTNTSGGFGATDILTAKYDTNGNIQWQRRLGGSSFDNGRSIAVDGSGNVYVAADSTSSGGFGAYDVIVVKYNTSGTLQWQRRFGTATGDFNYGIAVDSTGSCYVSGVFYTTRNIVFVAKYDTSGTLQWQRSLSSAGEQEPYAITVDGSGNYYIAGYTTLTDPGGLYNVLIAKLPTDGSLTGTYGAWTYAASSLTDAASSLSDNTPTLTDAARTLDLNTTTLTSSTSTLTSTVTTV